MEQPSTPLRGVLTEDERNKMADDLMANTYFPLEDIEDEVRRLIDQVNERDLAEPDKDGVRQKIKARTVRRVLDWYASFNLEMNTETRRAGPGTCLRLNGEEFQFGAAFTPYWTGSGYVGKGQVYRREKAPINFEVAADSLAALTAAAQEKADEIEHNKRRRKPKKDRG